MRAAFFILWMALLAGCSRPATDTHQVWNESHEGADKYGDTFDWQNRSAIEFLTLLEQQSGNFYTVHGLHHDWLRDSDIDTLMARLDCQTPCAHVVISVSSHLPQGRSTVGHEAAYLLEGYRQHFYPPDLASDRFEPNLTELRHWHRKWSTRR